MIKKLFVGIAVSTVFVYLALRGVDLKEVLGELRNKSYGFLLPITAVFILTQIVRSVRWGVLLSPIEKIDQKTLFPMTCVGFMAIVVAPVRMGEIVRPYLVSVKRSVPLGSGIATVLMERVIDMSMVLGFLFLVLLHIPLPPWLVRGGKLLLALILPILTVIIILVMRREAMTKMLLLMSSRLPQKISIRIEGLLLKFIDGLMVISDMKKLFQVLSLSLMIWMLSALAVYLLFSFFDLRLGIIEAITVMVITTLGVGIPSAPGFLGNFHFACIVALSLWGVPKNDAFTFAMVYYFLGIGVIIFLGLIFLPFMDLPVKQIFSPKALKGD